MFSTLLWPHRRVLTAGKALHEPKLRRLVFLYRPYRKGCKAWGETFDCFRRLMFEVLDVFFSERVQRAAVGSLFAAGVVGSFTLSGFFNGVAGSALTAKLRSQGLSSMMRQEVGYYDQEANTAAELTAFLAERVDKVKTITAEQLDRLLDGSRVLPQCAGTLRAALRAPASRAR